MSLIDTHEVEEDRWIHPAAPIESVTFEIFDGPPPFPDAVIVRAVRVRGEMLAAARPLRDFWPFPDIPTARRAIAKVKPNARIYDRSDEDPPSLVETWF